MVMSFRYMSAPTYVLDARRKGRVEQPWFRKYDSYPSHHFCALAKCYQHLTIYLGRYVSMQFGKNPESAEHISDMQPRRDKIRVR